MSSGPNVNANFADMKIAGQEFQNALESCQATGAAVESLKTELQTAYASTSSQTYLPKLIEWQSDFTRVEGALARMTLELAETNKDYIKSDDEAAEIAAAIKAQLGG
jgi:uncharacterized protein YukE